MCESRSSEVVGRVMFTRWLATPLSTQVPGLSSSGPGIRVSGPRDAALTNKYVLIKLEISDTFMLQLHQEPHNSIFPLVIASQPRIYILEPYISGKNNTREGDNRNIFFHYTPAHPTRRGGKNY